MPVAKTGNFGCLVYSLKGSTGIAYLRPLKPIFMQHLTYQRDGHVGTLTLNRPKAYNSFHRALALEVQAQLDACAADPELRVLVLTGAGRAFSAGQDIGELTGPNPPVMEQILTEHYNPIVERIAKARFLVIAAVNGVAAGAGGNLAFACDLTVATESAAFTQAFSKIGLIPDSGGTFYLPRILGRQRALGLMLTSEKISATEAERLGLLYKVYPDDDFAAQTTQLARHLASLPPVGLALTKRAVRESWQNDLTAQLALEAELQIEAGNTEDYREAITAFIEKRPAVVKGK